MASTTIFAIALLATVFILAPDLTVFFFMTLVSAIVLFALLVAAFIYSTIYFIIAILATTSMFVSDLAVIFVIALLVAALASFCIRS